MSANTASATIQLSSKKFLIGCLISAGLLFSMGWIRPFPTWFLGIEVLATVIALFVLGSIRYRLDKNALTYGAGIVITATFLGIWWPTSAWREAVQSQGWSGVFPFLKHHLLTLHGLEGLIHADTMLFILGLTFFVAAISQTRLLESLSIAVLERFGGDVVPTLIVLTGTVAIASGIIGGVSMIGLMIRIMLIILFLSQVSRKAVLFVVVVSTIITTVCGMWFTYGEPPNLIMRSNLYPHLTDSFFLRYCLPMAFASFLVVAWNMRVRLRGKHVRMADLDELDRHQADVRFIQAVRHGEVFLPREFVDRYPDLLGEHHQPILDRLFRGEALGEAMVRENVSSDKRRTLLGKYISEDLAEALDDHYSALVSGRHDRALSQSRIHKALEGARNQRLLAQRIGIFSFLPFIGLLLAHGLNREIPLFLASFAGFAVAILAIARYPKMKTLAMREARHEFAEYFFLLPLFFSIALLKASGFFDPLGELLRQAITYWGSVTVAIAQFWGATLLSAILDNNVVADFASHMLHGLEISQLHLFAMAQIAGYGLGGCWTHIGSAQSVVAYSFIQKDVDPDFTPIDWIRLITGIILQIALVTMAIIFLENKLLHN